MERIIAKRADKIVVGDMIWHEGNETGHTVRRVEVAGRHRQIWAGSIYSGDLFLDGREFKVIIRWMASRSALRAMRRLDLQTEAHRIFIRGRGKGVLDYHPSMRKPDLIDFIIRYQEEFGS